VVSFFGVVGLLSKGLKDVRTYPDIPVPIILGVGVVADGFTGGADAMAP
jgi:hypothetical protein